MPKIPLGIFCYIFRHIFFTYSLKKMTYIAEIYSNRLIELGLLSRRYSGIDRRM